MLRAATRFTIGVSRAVLAKPVARPSVFRPVTLVVTRNFADSHGHDHKHGAVDEV